MKKKILSKEFVIGISVIVTICILIFGIDYLKGINLFRPSNFYIANYENVAGLELSAPVTIDGYKVGQVREINFNYKNPGKIEVVLALNKELKLPEDSYAEISSTLLSGSYINIVVGKNSKMLDVGGEIQTKSGSDLMDKVQKDIMPAIAGMVPKIDALLVNLNALVANPALSQSINRLDGITNNVLYATGDLRTTLGRDVPAIMGGTRGVIHNLDSITYNLQILSHQLKTLPLEPTMNNIEHITENLTRFSEQLNSKESTLGLMMNDPELYNRLNQISADIDSLVVDIKKNPKRYISIKLL